MQRYRGYRQLFRHVRQRVAIFGEDEDRFPHAAEQADKRADLALRSRGSPRERKQVFEGPLLLDCIVEARRSEEGCRLVVLGIRFDEGQSRLRIVCGRQREQGNPALDRSRQ